MLVFEANIHSYLTMEELRIAFKQVGFECTPDEVRLIFAEQQALQSNYLPMDMFFIRVASNPACNW